jgi:excisionase family DNA binding protein
MLHTSFRSRIPNTTHGITNPHKIFKYVYAVNDEKLAISGQLLTAQEVAALLIVPVSTLYHWRSVGQGPAGFRIGKQLRYRAADVTAWLEERATSPSPRQDATGGPSS